MPLQSGIYFIGSRHCPKPLLVPVSRPYVRLSPVAAIISIRLIKPGPHGSMPDVWCEQSGLYFSSDAGQKFNYLIGGEL